VLVLYLQNYGLQKKRYAFTIWNQIHKRITKEHLSHIGLVKINQLICDLKLVNGEHCLITKVDERKVKDIVRS
jgi:hypothetical protein